ncbi:uncharacterized protein LOC117178066 [Belonocnema kinseyi]|uniref:uncharacterized protein LOC117178066 n=1 Tax=Belonocnema kinseyi TaxID=2817044 RepID=UPI00143CDECB|nr:uncharacterized protein LOC117178066 [Belonocnema kinseyi]
MNLTKTMLLSVLCAALIFGIADAWNCDNHPGKNGTPCASDDNCCSTVCLPSVPKEPNQCQGDVCKAKKLDGKPCKVKSDCCSYVCGRKLTENGEVKVRIEKVGREEVRKNELRVIIRNWETRGEVEEIQIIEEREN